jgi:hypothetical protein
MLNIWVFNTVWLKDKNLDFSGALVHYADLMVIYTAVLVVFVLVVLAYQIVVDLCFMLLRYLEIGHDGFKHVPTNQLIIHRANTFESA